MNSWADILLIGIIGYNAFKGYQHGLIQVLINMSAFILSFTIASSSGGLIVSWIQAITGQPMDTSTVVSHVAIWLLVYLGLTIGGTALSKMLPFLGLGGANRMGGVIVGTLRGLLICVPLILLIQIFDPNAANLSAMLPALSPLATWASKLIF